MGETMKGVAILQKYVEFAMLKNSRVEMHIAPNVWAIVVPIRSNRGPVIDVLARYMQHELRSFTLTKCTRELPAQL